MRFMPLVLLVGIIFNFVCVVVFRLKLDRKMSSDFDKLSESLQGQVSDLTVSALRSIDSYFVSNSIPRSSSSVSSSSSSDEMELTFHKEIGEWDYDYFLSDGFPLARVGPSYFRVGDSFPRGGKITDIFPDCVVVNDRFFFRNRTFVSRSLSPSSSVDKKLSFVDTSDVQYKPNKELLSHVGTVDKLRQ